MYTLNTKIEHLPGVGPSLKKTLNNLGLFYIEDLLFHLPFRYIDFSSKTSIGSSEVDQMVTLEGQIQSVEAKRSFRSRLQYTEAVLEDSTGEIRLMWFNQPYIAQQFKVGERIVVAGKVEWYKQKQLTNPYFEKVDSENTSTGKILPIYHLTKGLSNLRLAKLIKLAWDNSELPSDDSINSELLKKHRIPKLFEALKTLHFPPNTRTIATARLRIAIDDCLPQQLASAIKQQALDRASAPVIQPDIDYIKDFLARLPFELTDSQKRAIWDTLQSLSLGKPHSRLIEGDVGSGKTMVALLTSLMVSNAGYQTIILAPTEILARQHFETFAGLAKDHKIGLLTRNFAEIGSSKKSKTELATALQAGEINIVVGTHALLSENLHFAKLGLIVIDEQHRFGVAQRAFLQKHHGSDSVPHLLSMSATPIPRSLALSLFGNLEISQLKQMPKNRLKIQTKLFAEQEREYAYNKIRAEIIAGRQAFVITPKVEESEDEVKSVKLEFVNLQRLFPNSKLGLVYGSMKGSEKDAVMAEFAAGNIDILVATTVIEIGIDVPNATVMLIEGAENFGLAQLHQLRGRVGRGQHQSYCYLFTTRDDQLETKRLKVFESTMDGFVLAEQDLLERGFGDLFGKQQSGFAFRFPDFITIAALKQARDIALSILSSDPQLSNHSQLKTLSDKYLESIHIE